MKIQQRLNKLGRRTGILLVFGLLMTGLASGALLLSFGTITGMVTVAQSVLVDGQDVHLGIISDTGGVHTLTNTAGVPVTVNFETDQQPEDVEGTGNVDGITTTYLKGIEYSETYIIDIEGSDYNLDVTVADDGDWIVWTFDFPVEEFTGDGNLNVGLIIALDGEGQGPAFQIHNNDGATGLYPVGTWMYGSWGPTIDDGWFGWPNHDLDVPIENLDWIEATGNRNVPHEGGVMEIRIKKSELGKSFHWAASPTVGSGFWDAYDVTMQIPTAFGWSEPLVTATNYEYAGLTENLVPPLTLQSGEVVEFYIVNDFDIALTPGTYTITTNISPN